MSPPTLSSSTTLPAAPPSLPLPLPLPLLLTTPLAHLHPLPPLNMNIPPTFEILSHPPRLPTPTTNPNTPACLARLHTFASQRRAGMFSLHTHTPTQTHTKKELQAKQKRILDKKKAVEKEAGKKMFGGTLAEVLRVVAELKVRCVMWVIWCLWLGEESENDKGKIGMGEERRQRERKKGRKEG
ncbi:hypothetical protein SBOR_0242 [Sclerotinia borealis F-4128]|uniref:Uncharacterized protein n=1 Tax=Sclerotinia borealis (strain F-4128) TaxID=1432307 RepID=W9CRF8_SCLBF|nr:hypothetical protein SBOR_0242 [Sclerotinia borealis F-4128]